MKQPVTVSVAREHANAGDVITTITGADGEVRRFLVSGEETSFSALRAMAPFLESTMNTLSLPAPYAPPPPEPDPEPEDATLDNEAQS